MSSENPPLGIGLLDLVIGSVTCIWFGQFLYYGALFYTVNILVPGVLLLGFSRYANGVGVRSLPTWLRYFHMVLGILILLIAFVPVFLIYFYPFYFATGWLNLALVAFSCDLVISGISFTGVSKSYDWFAFAMGITGLVLASVVQFIPILIILLSAGFLIASIFTVLAGGYLISINRQARQ
jgi:hypothetical protein